MNCHWCNFRFRELGSDFSGYITFDKYGKSSNLYFCSINCCSAYITLDKNESVNNIDIKLDYLYNRYNIKGIVTNAKDPKRLKCFGGDLSYEEYRSNFTCPNFEDSYRENVSINYIEDYINDFMDRSLKEKEYIEYYDREFSFMNNEEEDKKEMGLLDDE
jgi:hypothetical protein